MTSNGKENISELLRSVDKVIKTGNLDQAGTLIGKILEINPKNIYAKAYRERLDTLHKEKEASLRTLPPPTPEPPAAAAEPPAATATVIPSPYIRKISDAVLEAYKTLLNEIWRDGSVTPLELERVRSMQEFFAIAEDEHLYLEQNARLTCYLQAIREEWNKGSRDFETTKERYRITPDEYMLLQPKVERLIKSLNSKGVILSLDDDRNFLLLMERLLEKNGYHSLNTTSGEEALNLLEHFSPDLVLCDIAFGQKNMNGFMFYERFRSIERFSSVPFIFISALNQKELIRTGKKIGVDDYLTKPVENDVLLATIEGRIRRAREMKKVIDY